MSARCAPLRLAAASCTVAALDAWLDRAGDGNMCIYAQGGDLDQAAPIARHVAALAKAGKVLAHMRGQGSDRQYLARKLPVPEDGTSGRPVLGLRDAVPPMLRPDTNSGLVYEYLSQKAAALEPCPTNREIALKLRLSDAEAARYLVNQLERAGHIEIDDRGPRITRVVKIIAAGTRTSVERIAVGKGFEKIGGPL